jgi:hypothetical protein
VGFRCTDHATRSIRKKLALTSPTRGGRSVSTVCSWTKATEFYILKVAACIKLWLEAKETLPIWTECRHVLRTGCEAEKGVNCKLRQGWKTKDRVMVYREMVVDKKEITSRS